MTDHPPTVCEYFQARATAAVADWDGQDPRDLLLGLAEATGDPVLVQASAWAQLPRSTATDAHTPGPWFPHHDMPSVICGRSGEKLATIVASTTFARGVSAQEAQANARRIIAAVNTCAGISTEAIEAGALGRLVAANDALLAACKGMLPLCRCDGGEVAVREYDAASGVMEETGRYDPCPHCGAGRAAIRLATGTEVTP